MRFPGKTGPEGTSGKAFGQSQRKNIQQRGTDPAAWRNHGEIANSQIRYIESNAHQLLIHTISGEVALYEKLDVYEKKLHKDFLRVHKSFLVNMQYIRRIEMKEVTLQDGTVLPVSKTRYSVSRDKYFRYMRAML